MAVQEVLLQDFLILDDLVLLFWCVLMRCLLDRTVYSKRQQTMSNQFPLEVTLASERC